MVVVRLEMKGWLNMEMGILAFRRGFWSSWSFSESFIFPGHSFSSCLPVVEEKKNCRKRDFNPVWLYLQPK